MPCLSAALNKKLARHWPKHHFAACLVTISITITILIVSDGDANATFTVPADKCGLVIGKGGEMIREINRMSEAYVELSRSQPPNPRETVFKFSGNPNQVQQAMRLISEKAGLPPPGPGGHGEAPGVGGPGGFDSMAALVVVALVTNMAALARELDCSTDNRTSNLPPPPLTAGPAGGGG